MRRLPRATSISIRLGFAHSVEVWLENELAGGLYGVSVYGAFFGESMFHKVPNASKVALVGLVNRLNERGFRLLDTQYVTRHLTMFGAVEISRPKYMRLLKQALAWIVNLFESSHAYLSRFTTSALSEVKQKF